MGDYVAACGYVQQEALTSEAERNALFHALAQAHGLRLYRFILKNTGHHGDAQDLAQQAFLEAVRSFPLFKGESELSTWLYGIALNLLRNHLSRAPQRRYHFTGLDVLEGVADPRLPPAEALEKKQQLRCLLDAFAGLPRSMQDILRLVAVDDMSYEEAAALLSVPVGTVRSRLSRARSALRMRLQAAGV